MLWRWSFHTLLLCLLPFLVSQSLIFSDIATRFNFFCSLFHNHFFFSKCNRKGVPPVEHWVSKWTIWPGCHLAVVNLAASSISVGPWIITEATDRKDEVMISHLLYWFHLGRVFRNLNTSPKWQECIAFCTTLYWIYLVERVFTHNLSS